MGSITFQASDSGFYFSDHYIRLVRNFSTAAGTIEDIGFVATDLAKALEMRRTADISDRLDPDQKGGAQISTPGGTQSLTVVSESGFYDVVVRSDKPQGKALRAVVTREILPAIRKTGSYGTQKIELQSGSPLDEAMKWLEFQAKLSEMVPSVDKGLLVNAAMEGAARQWPNLRPPERRGEPRPSGRGGIAPAAKRLTREGQAAGGSTP